jgi:hypothetical protein
MQSAAGRLRSKSSRTILRRAVSGQAIFGAIPLWIHSLFGYLLLNLQGALARTVL